MSPTLTMLLTFGAVTTAVFGVISIMADLRKGTTARVNRRIDEATRDAVRERVKKSSVFKDMTLLADSVSSQSADTATTRKRLQEFIEQAGITMTVEGFLGLSAAFVLGGALIGWLVSHGALVTFCVSLVMAPLPFLWIKSKRAARLEKMLSQLPTAFDLMGRVIRAGQSIPQAFQSAADQLEPPISIEFAYCSEQQNLGIPTETALRDLAQRTGLIDLKILVVGVLVQQQTGGNLAEMLDSLSSIIRDRYRMRGVIQTLTAEGRLQAMILLGLPPAMFLIMFAMNRRYALELFDHPSLIGMTLISEALGALWIRSIVNFTV